MLTINISKQFSTTPGGRYKVDGPASGEEFRERFLEESFKNKHDNSKIEIILDGVSGYGTSFLDEIFGGLARNYGKKRCLERFIFISNEDPLLIDEIIGYINESDKE